MGCPNAEQPVDNCVEKTQILPSIWTSRYQHLFYKCLNFRDKTEKPGSLYMIFITTRECGKISTYV